MKILVAPAAFKESVSAHAVARAIADGLKGACPRLHVVEIPLSDGGNGFLEAVCATTGARLVRRIAIGPLGNHIPARFALSRTGSTAFVESASVCGLHLVPPRHRSPLTLTTRGLGELMLRALSAGARKVVVGLGGSAMMDGGVGALEALGARFLDRKGRRIEGIVGADLCRIADVDVSSIHPLVRRASFVCACDVASPLLGPDGAARRFGPQKGATAREVAFAEESLRAYSRVLASLRPRNGRIASLPGAGAAGAMGLSLAALCGARLVQGAELVLRLAGFAGRLRGAGLLVVGEGRIDATTALGKAPCVAARMAKARGIATVAVCGRLGRGWRSLKADGIVEFFPIAPGSGGPVLAEDETRARLRAAGRRVADWLTSRKK
ncbi:MAG: glycerate kinase [Planctomycetota bacterium]|nr:glycerate kinase [Planctomycetota bacterium]